MRRKIRKKKRINYDLITNKRFTALLVILVVAFIVILCRSFYVMVIQKEHYIAVLDELNTDIVTFNSAPRGRILDRNYKVIVDNKALKTIVYKKSKGVSKKDMIDLSYTVSSHLELDLSKLTLRSKKEFYEAKNSEDCLEKIKDSEWEKVKQRKLTNNDIYELKIERITDEDLGVFSDDDLKAAYLYYLMNKGYTYE